MRYKIRDQHGMNYLTFTVVDWRKKALRFMHTFWWQITCIW